MSNVHPDTDLDPDPDQRFWVLQYDKDGTVSQIPGVKTFPMTKDPVMGKKHPLLAPKLMSG